MIHVPDHGAQYEETPASQYGGMCEDGHPDRLIYWTLPYIPQFHVGGEENNNNTGRQSNQHLAYEFQ